MGIEAVSVGILNILLLLLIGGVFFTPSAMAMVRRFGRQGLVVYWLAISSAVALWVGSWGTASFPDSAERVWNFYLAPWLFLLVQLGLVALYLWRSQARGSGPLRQFLLGFLTFLAATVPALAAAMIPAALLR